jgi:hypothetical protein
MREAAFFVIDYLSCSPPPYGREKPFPGTKSNQTQIQRAAIVKGVLRIAKGWIAPSLNNEGDRYF